MKTFKLINSSLYDHFVAPIMMEFDQNAESHSQLTESHLAEHADCISSKSHRSKYFSKFCYFLKILFILKH